MYSKSGEKSCKAPNTSWKEALVRVKPSAERRPNTTATFSSAHSIAEFRFYLPWDRGLLLFHDLIRLSYAPVHLESTLEEMRSMEHHSSG